MNRAWVLALALALACTREQPERAPTREHPPTPETDATPSPDPAQPTRARPQRRYQDVLIRGLDAAARDRAIAEQLDLAGAFASEPVSEALERTLARVAGQRDVQLASDRFFAALQAGPGMRAALVEYAKAHPELEIAELQRGFVSHVQQRLTRPELAEQLELALRLSLRSHNLALAQALLIDAHLDASLALHAAGRLELPDVADRLATDLQLDDLPARAEARLADPRYAAELVRVLGEVLHAPEGQAALAEIVDHEEFAALLGAALTRLLLDEQVRGRCEDLFTLALAPTLDPDAFATGLAALLHEPNVAAEAELLLRTLTLEPWVRSAIGRAFTPVGRSERMDEVLRRMLG